MWPSEAPVTRSAAAAGLSRVPTTVPDSVCFNSVASIVRHWQKQAALEDPGDNETSAPGCYPKQIDNRRGVDSNGLPASLKIIPSFPEEDSCQQGASVFREAALGNAVPGSRSSVHQQPQQQQQDSKSVSPINSRHPCTSWTRHQRSSYKEYRSGLKSVKPPNSRKPSSWTPVKGPPSEKSQRRYPSPKGQIKTGMVVAKSSQDLVLRSNEAVEDGCYKEMIETDDANGNDDANVNDGANLNSTPLGASDSPEPWRVKRTPRLRKEGQKYSEVFLEEGDNSGPIYTGLRSGVSRELTAVATTTPTVMMETTIPHFSSGEVAIDTDNETMKYPFTWLRAEEDNIPSRMVYNNQLQQHCYASFPGNRVPPAANGPSSAIVTKNLVQAQTSEGLVDLLTAETGADTPEMMQQQVFPRNASLVPFAEGTILSNLETQPPTDQLNALAALLLSAGLTSQNGLPETETAAVQDFLQILRSTAGASHDPSIPAPEKLLSPENVLLQGNALLPENFVSGCQQKQASIAHNNSRVNIPTVQPQQKEDGPEQVTVLRNSSHLNLAEQGSKNIRDKATILNVLEAIAAGVTSSPAHITESEVFPMLSLFDQQKPVSWNARDLEDDSPTQARNTLMTASPSTVFRSSMDHHQHPQLPHVGSTASDISFPLIGPPPKMVPIGPNGISSGPLGWNLASRRWQNLNVVLPLYVPYGTVAVLGLAGENTYVFPDTEPSAQLLLSGAGRVCDHWATYLRLRVAVVHKCPDHIVPLVAQLFREVLAQELPKSDAPVRLICSGLVKHTIQLRSGSGGLTYRYDTIGQLAEPEDHQQMRAVFAALQKLMVVVNSLALRLQSDAVNTDSFGHSTGTQRSGALSSDYPRIGANEPVGPNVGPGGVTPSGMEFRFSPCRELKIAVREGSLCDLAGVDAHISGGGMSSMSSWAQQFRVSGLIAGELRLERDKSSETECDPFFLPEAELGTRLIARDSEGLPARAVFVKESVYPKMYRPRVRLALGLSAPEASAALCGSSLRTLAAMLPRGSENILIKQSVVPSAVASQPFTSSRCLPSDDGTGPTRDHAALTAAAAAIANIPSISTMSAGKTRLARRNRCDTCDDNIYTGLINDYNCPTAVNYPGGNGGEPSTWGAEPSTWRDSALGEFQTLKYNDLQNFYHSLTTLNPVYGTRATAGYSQPVRNHYDTAAAEYGGERPGLHIDQTTHGAGTGASSGGSQNSGNAGGENKNLQSGTPAGTILVVQSQKS